MSTNQRMTEEIRSMICKSVEQRMFAAERAAIQEEMRQLVLDTVLHQVGGQMNFDALKSLMRACPRYVAYGNRCPFTYIAPPRGKQTTATHIRLCAEFEDPIPHPHYDGEERDPKLVARAVAIDKRDHEVRDKVVSARRALYNALLSFSTVKKLLAAMPELDSDVPGWAKQEAMKPNLPTFDAKATVAMLFKTGALPAQQKAA